jgi:hypothetical protein
VIMAMCDVWSRLYGNHQGGKLPTTKISNFCLARAAAKKVAAPKAPKVARKAGKKATKAKRPAKKAAKAKRPAKKAGAAKK